MSEGRILVVEDEPSIREVVSLYLRRAGYQVTVVEDGQAALDSLAGQLPDLVVLDLMLPHVDGLEITRWLRERGDTPIIMLTARREERDRIAGLEMGADDYVVKPFSPQELVSRVRAVLRRTRGSATARSEQPLAFGDLRIDPQTRLVTIGDEEKTLTVKEFDLLWMMARNPRHRHCPRRADRRGKRARRGDPFLFCAAKGDDVTFLGETILGVIVTTQPGPPNPPTLGGTPRFTPPRIGGLGGLPTTAETILAAWLSSNA